MTLIWIGSLGKLAKWLYLYKANIPNSITFPMITNYGIDGKREPERWSAYYLIWTPVIYMLRLRYASGLGRWSREFSKHWSKYTNDHYSSVGRIQIRPTGTGRVGRSNVWILPGQHYNIPNSNELTLFSSWKIGWYDSMACKSGGKCVIQEKCCIKVYPWVVRLVFS
jgi:hypothetical protein